MSATSPAPGAFGEPDVAPHEAAFVVVPVPYEQTTTYRKGTAKGPAALLAAATQVETFDEETRREPLAAGVALLDPVREKGAPDRLADRLEALVGPHLDEDRVVACLGGEHSVSLGPIRASARRHPGLGVLQIDAHPDLRDAYEGTRYGHGCVMRRALDDERVGGLVQVGLRAVSEEDDAAMRADARIRPFYAYDLAQRPASEWITEVVDACPATLYVSIDLDGLDPAIVSGTGTPEPGGLAWWEVLGLLRAVARRRRVVAFDLVELLPEPPAVVSDFAAAKLLFKMLAYLTEHK